MFTAFEVFGLFAHACGDVIGLYKYCAGSHRLGALFKSFSPATQCTVDGIARSIFQQVIDDIVCRNAMLFSTKQS
jgi:hypothetical protein